MKTFTSLMVCAFILGINFNILAQSSEKEPAQAILLEVNETNPKTFYYDKTPHFCLGNNKRFFKNYNEDQLFILESYEYPLFTSYGYATLEQDIQVYKEAIKQWNIDNLNHKTEILECIKNN